MVEHKTKLGFENAHFGGAAVADNREVIILFMYIYIYIYIY
jgi:hypothetical protein